MAGNYAYVADNSRGLRVINVANPAVPVEVGFYDTPGYAYEVALAGSYAYVVDYNRGLRVINVANPAAPTEVGFYDTPGSAQGVTVAGGYVHVVAYGGYVNGGGLFVLRFTGVTYTISGRVTDASGHGILGVTVWAGSPRNTTTDANGDYTFTELPAGTYGIRPDKDPYVFSPAFRTVTVPPNASGINFAAQPPDLRVAHIEVAQVFVEERDPTSQIIISLIAKKDTLVRVFVGVSGAPSVYGVTAHLHMRNAFGVERTITQSVNPWPVQAGQNPDPNHLQDTINFRPPPDLLLGNMTFWATVDPNNYIVESNEDNNIDGNIMRPFRSGQPTGDPLRIAWMSLGYANLQAPFIHLADPSIAARGDKALRQIYPVGAGDVEYFFQPGFSEVLSVKLNGHEASYRRAVNRFWNDVSRSSGWVGGTPDRLYAWIPGIARDPYETCGVADPVWDEGNGRVAIGADACDKTLGGAAKNISPDEVMAHEIGHVLNSHDELRHTPNDAGGDCFAATGETGPYPNATPKGSIIAHGLDVVKLKVLDPQHTYDLMSYCKPSWASPTNYERLLGGFEDPPNLNATGTQSVVSIRQLLVSGMVYSPTMQVDLDPFYAVISAVPPSPNMGSDYCLEALAANGSRLDGRCFNLGFDHSEVSLSPSNTPGAEDSFALSIPYPTDTARVVLTHLGASIATRAISAHAPTVRLISPNGGETWVGSGAYTVTWTAGDLDGDPLHFALAYSTDGGASWIPTGLDLTGTQHALDVSMLPGGTSVLLRISATDGVNTTDDVSDGPFTVGRKVPQAFILSPEDGARFFPGTAIWLEGRAFDLEDGTLDDAALRWTSNRDGGLGTGGLLIATLSPGEHVITLTATDSDGNTVVATIRLSAGHRLFLPTVSRGH
ncbi:carboxypeptidase regulatory-like domain-containing protein [Candidatus Amarobacter glycogenicus]|uniref:carboxypeptidase regulatory-like domain-containing protein n=1 Tax=Candidatus Amarobacter glycogenicus TaxID=3140699 RepID=UPI0031351EC9|nr:carboxypeptidase regulatory-like domain-containing protein [Dehalococcoidia bacterium]